MNKKESVKATSKKIITRKPSKQKSDEDNHIDNRFSVVIHNSEKEKPKPKKRKKRVIKKKATSKGVSSTNQVPSVIISNTNPHPYSYPYPYQAPVSAYDAPPRYTEEQVRNARLQQFDNGLVQQALSPNNENKHDALVQEVISPTPEENALLSTVNQSNTVTDTPQNYETLIQQASSPQISSQKANKKRKINGDEQETSGVFTEIGFISRGPNKGDLNLNSVNKELVLKSAKSLGINTDGLTVKEVKKKISNIYKSFKESKHKKK
jgi:hypothetical protein